MKKSVYVSVIWGFLTLFLFTLQLSIGFAEVVESFYDDGTVKSRVTYIDDVKEGPFTHLFPDGTIYIEGNYINGELDGLIQRYHANGNIAEATFFKNNKKNGSEKIYSEEGILLAEREYKDDLLDGWAHIYYPSGTLKEKTPYVRGKEMGYSYGYSTTEQLTAEVGYFEGRKHGTAKFYWPNGKIRVSKDYEYGKLHGHYILFDESGNEKNSRYYENGVRIDAGAYPQNEPKGFLENLFKGVRFNSDQASESEGVEDDV